MNKQICKYSIIRFQPYPETEEFANIGIVLYATASKRLEFRLLDGKQHARITGFFDPMCKDVFVQTSKIIRAEIDRIKHFLEETVGGDIDLYAELIRCREDIIRFSNSRVLFCTDPVATVDKLFDHYIHRSFIHEPGHEDKMKKQVRDLLDRSNLGEKYKEGTIGEQDKYEVRFPFVCQNTKKTVIKPIHFKHEKPSQLIDHGLSWLAKIQQLEKYRFIRPDEILFTYDAPDNSQSNLFAAFNEIKKQIESEGILMADIKRIDDIVKFAAA
ncbi:DUF3037 domain-containing protein [Methylobacter sp. G7]|uniref:DUF3037 domain-containing protein n=1 Tax=Methylobacter sp. G7 TaxID=3230117 RepID=UPI003D809FCD